MDGIYILSGIGIGIITGYFIARWKLMSGFVTCEEAEQLRKQVSSLMQQNASKLSKEEVQDAYVPRELAAHYLGTIEKLQERLREQEQASHRQQEELLQLTREAEQKIPKTVVDAKDALILELKTALTAGAEKERAMAEKMEWFRSEVEQLHRFAQEQFKTLAGEVLEEKKKLFVTENKKEMTTLLDPLKTDLNQFREKVEATRKEDIREVTSLKKEIESLQKLNAQLSDDARNLATALKAEVKMQGNWGEDRLNLILETEGLQKYIDYTREEVFRDQEADRSLRPDFILRLPNGKHIIIDSKVSLTAYVGYFNTDSPEQKQAFLKQHVKSIADHIEKLADKNYQSLAGLNAPDYVFLFAPVEGALTLALNQRPDLFNQALKRKIVLITPTTLVATLKIVKLLWQKENQVKNVEEIFRQCGELYDKFVRFISEMDRVEEALQQAAGAHRDAMNHLKDGTRKGNTIIGRFERIRSLEAKVNKSIPEKYLAELELLPDDNEKEREADTSGMYNLQDNE
ncbi:recombinase RmuC [Niabella ginsenosidivorans]|uniref:Recombinase RmuC n=1 Tax=Niabella ginsenosidivorans TaxID=1176587 RepID=A0A1A9I2M9_9BACT|nr:DNA recombination protein RmuC [Niabella ginsenosidivorans]ANH80951.1 recombinase RmuC [Niabella ginsenosidivorans]